MKEFPTGKKKAFYSTSEAAKMRGITLRAINYKVKGGVFPSARKCNDCGQGTMIKYTELLVDSMRAKPRKSRHGKR